MGVFLGDKPIVQQITISRSRKERLMKRSHIVLIAGLGSSWFWRWNPWSRWARTLEKRLKAKYADRPDVVITAVSADGAGEKKAIDAIRADRDARRLGTVCMAGHSNGFRDMLRAAELLYPDTEIAYCGGIDMTLGEFGAQAYGNIAVLEEFHGVLQRADFHPSFRANDRKHLYWETKVGHTASATLAWVQNRIYEGVTGAIR